MGILVLTLVLLAALGWGTAWFLWSQMQRKFAMCYNGLHKPTSFLFNGAADFNRTPHQRNFLVKSSDGLRFNLTVYLKLAPLMADPFLSTMSDENGTVVVSIFVGNGPAHLYFDASTGKKLIVTSTDADQNLRPFVQVLPHWFQQGIFLDISSWIGKNLLKL
jgi:hypothetical protein